MRPPTTQRARNIVPEELPPATSWGARKMPAPSTSPTTRMIPSRVCRTGLGADRCAGTSPPVISAPPCGIAIMGHSWPSRRSAQVQLPGLAHQVVPEAVVPVLFHQAEAGSLVDATGGMEHVVGP